MRYNIYQVSDQPIAKGEWMTSADFFDRSFIGTIRDVGSRKKELERFGRWLTTQKFGALSGNSFTLVPDVCQKRFASRYPAFLKSAAAFSSVTEEQFQSGTGVEDLLFNLRQLFTDEFDDYVFYDDELLPMDSFFVSPGPMLSTASAVSVNISSDNKISGPIPGEGGFYFGRNTYCCAGSRTGPNDR